MNFSIFIDLIVYVLGQVGKNTVPAEQEKNNEHSFQDIDDKLSESTDDDGEDDTNDEDDEDSNPNKDTHAPLELMAEVSLTCAL